MQESKKDKLKWTLPISSCIIASISKQVNAATKTTNNIIAYEISKLLRMRISLTKDHVFEAIMTGVGCLCPVAFSILLLNPPHWQEFIRKGPGHWSSLHKWNNLLFYFVKTRKTPARTISRPRGSVPYSSSQLCFYTTYLMADCSR